MRIAPEDIGHDAVELKDPARVIERFQKGRYGALFLLVLALPGIFGRRRLNEIQRLALVEHQREVQQHFMGR